MKLSQEERDSQAFIKLMREAHTRNDGRYLAVVALLCIDQGNTELLEGHTTEDYQKALKALQWGISNAPPNKYPFQAAIDYISTNFLKEGVVADG
jgi:hypothetical protein